MIKSHPEKPIWEGKVNGRNGEVHVSMYQREEFRGLGPDQKHLRLEAFRKGGERAGYVVFGYGPVQAYLQSILIDVEHKGKGIGEKLSEIAVGVIDQEMDGRAVPNQPINVRVIEGAIPMEKILRKLDFRLTEDGWQRPIGGRK